jgi:hypothetical protein
MSAVVERSDASPENMKGKLFVYNYQYRSLGGFEKKLGDLIFHADDSNQKKLLKGFPEETQAVMDYQSVEGWWDICERDVEEYYTNKRRSK